MRATRLLGCMAAATAVAMAAAAASEADVSALTQGVKVINTGGLPGPLGVFGDKAFAVAVGQTKGRSPVQLPLVAAARFGKGRAVAFGKDGFFSAGVFEMGDTGQMIENAIRWAAGTKRKPKVGVQARKDIVPVLAKRGFDVRAIGIADLNKVDVVIARPNRCSDAEIEKLAAFVSKGGGLLAGELGWGWLQLNPGKTLSRDFKANKLFARMGIVWIGGMASRTAKNGFEVGGDISPLVNCSDALEAAIAHDAKRRKLSKKQLQQVTAVLLGTLQALPPDDAILMPRIEKLRKMKRASLLPAPRKPLKNEHVLARLLLTLELREDMAKPADQVEAHPAAAAFPGATPADAETVSRTLEIDTSVPRWHSTGLYAPAGKHITVSVPTPVAKASAQRRRGNPNALKVRIGTTTCRLWSKPRWHRCPEITREFRIDKPRTLAANAFGGLVYIVVPDKCALGKVSVTIDGCVEAPYYVLGETSLEDWRKTVRHYPAPWAELAGKKAILTVPSARIRKLDDPERLMKLWDRIQDTCAELAQWKPGRRRFAQRYCADVQLCAGYMHAGYPIMIPTSTAGKLVDYDHLTQQGDWGFFHETGHNHQSRDWTFGGTGEVTVNLFSMYLFEKIAGVKPGDPKGRMQKEGIKKQVRQYFAKPRDFSQWKRKPFLALYMYYQMQQGFGWDAFKKVFAEYRDLPAAERPKNDDQRRDQWLVRFSRTVGRNLGPFFEAWGVPTSAKARASIKGLPVWMPEGFPPSNQG